MPVRRTDSVRLWPDRSSDAVHAGVTRQRVDVVNTFIAPSGYATAFASFAAPKETSKRLHQMLTLLYLARSTSAGSW